ncbi:MAG: biopolymer transporter ExbD [Verrucomicrobiota bacterium]
MKLKRSKLLTEPPHSATSDIAFILIVFFLVCASVQPDSGRPQTIPKSEEEPDKDNQSKNIEVQITRSAVILDGSPLTLDKFRPRILSVLAEKDREEDRVVLVKSKQDTPYSQWILVTGVIEEAGGIITLQIEEERAVSL